MNIFWFSQFFLIENLNLFQFEIKIKKTIKNKQPMKKKIIIFASGSGSNAQRIVEYFADNDSVVVSSILTNNPKAGVIERAQKLGVDCLLFNRDDFYNSHRIKDFIQKINPDLIILAGFLWKFPENLTRDFQGKIINIHPSLLPKYGGKGMYGMNVHRAVIENNETQSGITIHFVNENYDEGKVLFHKEVHITPQDTPETLAEKIHQLEYQYFPLEIEKLLFN